MNSLTGLLFIGILRFKQSLVNYHNILRVNELKLTGMGEFNSDDRYIYYCGQESLRRNGVAIIVNKRVRNTVQFSSTLSPVRLFATP